MKLETLRYGLREGWSREPPSELDSGSTLVIAFGASDYLDTPDPICELAAVYPSSHVIGCSSSGEIFGTSVSDETLSVAVVQFERATVATAQAPIRSPNDSFAAGQGLGQRLADPSLQAVFVLSDGLNVNGSELVRGINSIVDASVIVTGGLAGDGDRFARTWVIVDALPQSGFASAVGLYGEGLKIGHGSKGGWDIFGPERTVTRSVGNILYELDGKPALQLYKEYLGERATGLPATGLLFPLALRRDASDQNQIVRTILAVDEEHQSMVFAGDIAQGYLAQLMRANFDRLVEGASSAAVMTKDNSTASGPVLAIAVSCVGRRLVLGERTEEEVEATLEVLPAGTQQIGFYSYGEISPVANGRCDLHNQTMTLTLISED